MALVEAAEQATPYRLVNELEMSKYTVDARGQPAEDDAAASETETESGSMSESSEKAVQERTRYGLGGGASGTGHLFGLGKDTTNLRTVFRACALADNFLLLNRSRRAHIRRLDRLYMILRGNSGRKQ